MTSVTVFIVDDDPGIRRSVGLLLETANIKSDSFTSAEDFLMACGDQPDGCLLLDVRMPGMSGPQLQDELTRRKITLPIIFLTGYADMAVAVGAMRQGAIDFLSKPINGAILLERVQTALEINLSQRQARAARSSFEARLSKLTLREREVLDLVLAGKVNKEISSQLQISSRTIEGHRSRIYLRVGVSSMLELAQLAARTGVPLAEIATLAR